VNSFHQPRFALPANSCDTHCHVFGPHERFPYSPDRKYEPEDSPKETLARLHQQLGIDRAVVVQASAHGTDNSAMLDALKWRPDRCRGVAMIDDRTEESMLVSMHEAGVRGIRFNFVRSLGGYPDMAMFNRAVERVAGLGWHVVLHLKGDDLLELRSVIAALPIPFVIDHMGRMDAGLGTSQDQFDTLLTLMELEHAWVKVSGAERMAKFPYTDALPFARALVDARPDRVLWGTDYPHPNLADPVDERDLIDLIPQFCADENLQQLLLVDNPARLYEFPRSDIESQSLRMASPMGDDPRWP
jgi:predicted TIM-barrel fold metal-dependent hydrolase